VNQPEADLWELPGFEGQGAVPNDSSPNHSIEPEPDVDPDNDNGAIAKFEGTFRILHTADLHFGKMLMDQSRDEDHSRWVDWLLAAVDLHGVDAVLIAGDVFDSANPPTAAEALYYRLLAELHARGVPAVVVAGNHDSPSHLRAAAAVLEPLSHQVRTRLCETWDEQIVLLPHPSLPMVAVAAVPYLREGDLRALAPPAETDSSPADQLAAGWKHVWEELAAAVDRVAGAIPAIAIGHLTVLGGSTNPETEREIRIGGLGDVDPGVFPERFSYVALGHLHRPQAHGRHGQLRYSGSPIALGFSEGTVARQVRLVDICYDGSVTDCGVTVDGTRRLVALRCAQADVRAELERIPAPAEGELTPWIDIELTDPDLFSDPERIARDIRTWGQDRGFVVLAVRRDALASAATFANGRTVDELMTELDGVKADPLSTLARLLDAIPGEIDPNERQAMLQMLADEILTVREER